MIETNQNATFKVENWTKEQRRNVRQQIRRTDSEAQKVENIVYYFFAQTSKESNIYSSDGDISGAMEDREELNFKLERAELKHYMDSLIISETLDFIKNAITEYTFFDTVDITEEEEQNGVKYVHIRAHK